jgi:WhiB family redox-sensing transcriptional regulator
MAVGDLPTLDQLFARPAWMADAACRGSAVNFHPERGQDTRAAKAVCAGCLVRDECRSYALGVGDKFGVWGGTTAKDRRSLLRRADPSAATSSGRSNSARARVDSARQRVV